MIEVEQGTNAGAVVETVFEQGELTGDAFIAKQCMLWEICQDFGIGSYFFFHKTELFNLSNL